VCRSVAICVDLCRSVAFCFVLFFFSFSFSFLFLFLFLFLFGFPNLFFMFFRSGVPRGSAARGYKMTSSFPLPSFLPPSPLYKVLERREKREKQVALKMPDFFVNCTPFHHSKPLEGVSAESALYISAQCISNRIQLWTDAVFIIVYFLAFLFSLALLLRHVLRRRTWGVAGNTGLLACLIQLLLSINFLVHLSLTGYFVRAFFTSLPATIGILGYAYVVVSWFSVTSTSPQFDQTFYRKLYFAYAIFSVVYVLITYVQLFMIFLYEKTSPLLINLIMGVATTWTGLVMAVLSAFTVIIGRKLVRVVKKSMDIEQDRQKKKRLENIVDKVLISLNFKSTPNSILASSSQKSPSIQTDRKVFNGDPSYGRERLFGNRWLWTLGDMLLFYCPGKRQLFLRRQFLLPCEHVFFRVDAAVHFPSIQRLFN